MGWRSKDCVPYDYRERSEVWGR